MKTVADILASKGTEIHAIAEESTVFEAVAAMQRHRIGCLLVKRGDRVLGIVTERDLLRRVVLEGHDPKSTAINVVVDTDYLPVEPQLAVDECMSLMTGSHRRHLPVFAEGSLRGLISIGDVVKHILDERHFEVQTLRDYITGKYPG